MRARRPSALIRACLALSAALTLAAPSAARADLFGLWVKPKFDYLSGTGEVFKRFEGSPAYGAELGLELLGISLWADYEQMQKEQFWATVNLGVDFDFDLPADLTLTVGAYGGAVFFGFPPSDEASQSDLEANSGRIQSVLTQAGLSYNTFKTKYEELQKQETAISNTAFGLNARLRGSLEYNITQFISVGAQVGAGWHLVMSGEQAAADVKSRAVDGFVASQSASIPAQKATQLKQELKDALGAEEANPDDLKGVNYSVGAFINFHL